MIGSYRRDMRRARDRIASAPTAKLHAIRHRRVRRTRDGHPVAGKPRRARLPCHGGIDGHWSALPGPGVRVVAPAQFGSSAPPCRPTPRRRTSRRVRSALIIRAPHRSVCCHWRAHASPLPPAIIELVQDGLASMPSALLLERGSPEPRPRRKGFSRGPPHRGVDTLGWAGCAAAAAEAWCCRSAGSWRYGYRRLRCGCAGTLVPGALTGAARGVAPAPQQPSEARRLADALMRGALGRPR
jgi:hypothetical protein